MNRRAFTLLELVLATAGCAQLPHTDSAPAVKKVEQVGSRCNEERSSVAVHGRQVKLDRLTTSTQSDRLTTSTWPTR